MSNKPIVYHLEFLIQKESYIVASLIFNKIKEELSYHFHHSSDSPQKHYTDGKSSFTVDAPPSHPTSKSKAAYDPSSR